MVYKIQGNVELALLSLNNAVFYLPGRREIHLEKAKYLSDIGRNIEAYFIILEAEKRTERIIDYHYNQSAWDSTFNNLKSDIYDLAKKEGLML